MKDRMFLIVTGLAYAAMLWMKLELGLTRYFDADEFAYLHWAHNVFAGRLPYRDFLLYVPPGFLWVVSPLFFFFEGTAVLTAGRVLAWLIFVGIGIALGLILVSLRGGTGARGAWGDWKIVFLPGIVLSFLPMPADKFIEIRPDNLALLLSLLGLLFQLRRRPFWAGILYALALLVLPKALPQVVIAALVFAKLPLLLGLGLPLAAFGLWVLAIGQGGNAWYSLMKLPFEVNRIGEMFGMQPDLFFYPNATYYGAGGWHWGLVANHSAWFVGLMTGVVRLLTPALGAARLEFLVAATFFSYIVTFMYGYPLRHAQYLIPIAAFVALYGADSLRMVQKRGPWGEVVSGALIAAMTYTSFFMLLQKGGTNADDFAAQRIIRRVIPKDAYVFDLTGTTIYYRDPYYVSAVPFGQWEPYLSRKLPSLREALEATGTRYVYQGKLSRVSTLSPNDRQYLEQNFMPSRELGADLLVKR